VRLSLTQGVDHHRFGTQEEVSRGQLATFLDQAEPVGYASRTHAVPTSLRADMER